jgi:hypothetical protein
MEKNDRTDRDTQYPQPLEYTRQDKFDKLVANLTFLFGIKNALIVHFPNPRSSNIAFRLSFILNE